MEPAWAIVSGRAGSGLPYGSGPIHFGVDGGLVFAPEPAAGSLLAAGLMALAVLIRHHRPKSARAA